MKVNGSGANGAGEVNIRAGEIWNCIGFLKAKKQRETTHCNEEEKHPIGQGVGRKGRVIAMSIRNLTKYHVLRKMRFNKRAHRVIVLGILNFQE